MINYLLGQLRLKHQDRIDVLRNFVPKAKESEWKLAEAGQRVQIIKNTQHGGILKMGTEVVSSADGSLAALLGASPGASTAVTIMLEVLKRCWSEKLSNHSSRERLSRLVPSLDKDLKSDQTSLNEMRERTDSFLNLI